LGLVCLALVGAPLSMYIVESSKAIQSARLKHAGIAPSKALLELVRLLQQHRGLSTSVLGGNRTMESQCATTQIETDKAVEAFDVIVRADIRDPALAAAWRRTVETWRTLANGVASRTIAWQDSFAAHTALIAEHLKLLDLMLDYFGLSYDPTGQDYHLIVALLVHIPNLTEFLGQARARGTLLLGQRRVTLGDRLELMSLIGGVERQHEYLEREFGKAMALNLRMTSDLGDIALASRVRAQPAMDLARAQVVAAEIPRYSPADYWTVFTKAIDNQFTLIDQGMIYLERGLRARIAASRGAQIMTIGFIACVIAVAGWLGTVVVRATRRDIAALQESETAQRGYAGELEATVERLKKTEATLIETERLRIMGEMASGIAHDFNNILTGILGQVLLLQTHLRQGMVEPDELRRNLRLLEQAALDGANVVRKIREATRPRGEEVFAPVSLNEVVEQVLDMTRPRWKDQIESQGLRVAMALELGGVPPVLGNAAELREALTNLLFNALDAMPKGGTVTIATRQNPPTPPLQRGDTGGFEMRKAEREGLGWVELTVTDTGVGMSQAVKARLFEPFFTTKGVKGTGLGLSMVQGIVRRHGGETHVASTEGLGTSMVLRLPAAQEGRPELTAPAPLPQLPSRLRLLVIDDDPLLGETLADLLRLLGHEVVVVTSGEEGLARLDAERFDLLITDLGMAGISGWEVARVSCARRPELPVIFVTGWGDQLEPAQLTEYGIDAVVAKPYTVHSLLEGLSLAWMRAQNGQGPGLP